MKNLNLTDKEILIAVEDINPQDFINDYDYDYDWAEYNFAIARAILSACHNAEHINVGNEKLLTNEILKRLTKCEYSQDVSSRYIRAMASEILLLREKLKSTTEPKIG